jgi:hypothetical protein
MRDGVFREAQYCFVNLRELQLFMDEASFCNPHDITMFLKSCPSMVKLFIDVGTTNSCFILCVCVCNLCFFPFFYVCFEPDFKLIVQLNDYIFDLGMYWKMHQKPLLDKCNHKFTQLKVVVLRSFKFFPSELELVKIILQKAVILERLFIIPPKINSPCKFKREEKPKYENMFGSWRASTKAIVKLHENYVEKSFVNPTHPKCWFPYEI